MAYLKSPSNLIPRSLLVLAFGIMALGHGLTLHEAQEILFKNNPDLAIMELDVERARNQVQEARAAWLPSVDAMANYNYTTETSRLKLELPFPPPGGTSMDKALGDHDRVEMGIDASYPIFTGFTRSRNLQAKREGLHAKEAQSQGAHNQISLQLGGMYYAWQIADLHAQFQKKILDYSLALQKQLQDFVKAGTGVRSLALGAEAKAKAAEVDLLTAQNTRDSLGFELLDFLGSRDTSLFTAMPELPPDSVSVPVPDWKTEPAKTGQEPTRPEVAALEHAVTQSRLGQAALAGQKYPQLYGVAGYRYANPGLNMAEDAFMQYGIFGLQLKWNLFDGSRNRSQRNQLQVQVRVLEEQKRKLASQWWKAEKLAQVQYSRWQSQYEAAMASRIAATTAAQDLKRQFDAGLATGLDWLEASNQAARAEMMMAQARTMQRLSLLQWRYAAGKELRY